MNDNELAGSSDADSVRLGNDLFRLAEIQAAKTGNNNHVATLVSAHDIWTEAADKYIDPRGALYEELSRYSIPEGFPLRQYPDMPITDLCLLVQICRDQDSSFDIHLKAE